MKLTQRQFRFAQIQQKNELNQDIHHQEIDCDQQYKLPISDSIHKGNLIKLRNYQGNETDKKPLQQIAQESFQSRGAPNNSFRRRLIPKQQKEVTSPRTLAQQDQGEVIEYLQKQNEQLLEENQKKQKLINRLLESCSTSSKISKIQSPRAVQQINQQPPKTVETKKVTSQVTRLPQIKTPQPNIKHRLETKETAQTCDESPTLYQCFSPGAIQQQQNWSFGKQINFDEESKQQSKACQLTFNTKQNTLNQKQISQPSLQIKTNFSKPLLKLPQEFHLQQWHVTKK